MRSEHFLTTSRTRHSSRNSWATSFRCSITSVPRRSLWWSELNLGLFVGVVGFVVSFRKKILRVEYREWGVRCRSCLGLVLDLGFSGAVAPSRIGLPLAAWSLVPGAMPTALRGHG